MPEEITDKLFKCSSAFDYKGTSQLFIDSIREMFAYQRANSVIFDGICRQYNFNIEDIKSEEDILRIPAIFVTAFKERKLLSVSQEEIVKTFTSSGTTGSKSQINWDKISMERQGFMRNSIVESYGLADYEQEVNNLIFSYDPTISGSRGAAHAHSSYAKFAKERETFFTITADKYGEPEFRLDEGIKALERFSQSGLPLRITGFPAFGYMTLTELDNRGIKFQFPADSVLFSGGGWKNYTGKTISYPEYVELVNRVLGIGADRIRDVYGMVEHGVPYMTCEHGHFHIPIYSRVCAVSPKTMEILPDGETGLLKLITPYIRSTPALSILSTDLGYVESNCPCGREGKYIVLQGRGGVKKYAGCGISAAQLLNR
ncbi:MAG: hypothetical protein PHR45_02705 [Muribaculaceae bacterium]|nr:hypothetical protein [Muribaculaceae bacterium]